MKKLEKTKFILSELEKIFPDAKTELENWETPFQFLVCIILSAQATDKQVNKVTKDLFVKYPSPKELAFANIVDVENSISSLNFFRNKAKHITAAANVLIDKYNGEVPTTVKELTTLPGVGYKTANVFLNDLFQLNQGVAVDTHVGRVARRLGLSSSNNPDKVAKDLESLYPKDEWYKINSTFVLFGRYNCKAKKPLCSVCPFTQICLWYKENYPVE
jgi:endonuclease-3